MVGTETSDDAAVWRLNDSQALVATTDFFMPVVDDPEAFGRIAATNALSDVYAMGGRPILALAIVGMPVDKLPTEVIGRILAGGAAVCAGGGDPGRGWALHRQRGADLWAGGAGAGASGPGADEPRRASRGRADPDQGARRGGVQRGAEAGAAGRGGVRRADRDDDAAERGGGGTGGA
jgi:hypothetical protein